jgi:hypothetical protein
MRSGFRDGAGQIADDLVRFLGGDAPGRPGAGAGPVGADGWSRTARG